MLNSLRRTLVANDVSQKFVEKCTKHLLKLQGYGVGANANRSGESWMIRNALAASNARPCIFDVGANVGQFAKLVLREVADVSLSLHSFEPGALAFKKLQDAVGADERATLNNVALGSENGEAILYADRSGSQLASLHKRRLEHAGIEFELSESIDVITLDSYCSSREIDQIDLLKIDAEGHELSVLEGGKQMLSEGKVNAVTFEFGGCNIDSRTYFQDFFYFFEDAGMDLFRIHPSGRAIPIPQYREIHEQFRTTNYLALRRER